MAILAKDVGRLILEDLRASAIKSMPNATEAEREESLAKFLNLWSGNMFRGPSGEEKK